MFLHVCVILFMGGSASVHAGIPPSKENPWQGDPLARQTPRQGRSSPVQCMLGDKVNKQAVCILLECNSCSIIFFCNPEIRNLPTRRAEQFQNLHVHVFQVKIPSHDSICTANKITSCFVKDAMRFIRQVQDITSIFENCNANRHNYV